MSGVKMIKSDAITAVAVTMFLNMALLSAQSDEIPIDNPGFEEPVLAEDAWDWTLDIRDGDILRMTEIWVHGILRLPITAAVWHLRVIMWDLRIPVHMLMMSAPQT